MLRRNYAPDKKGHKKLRDLGDCVVPGSTTPLPKRDVEDGSLYAGDVTWAFAKPTAFQYAVLHAATTDLLLVCFDLGETTAKKFVLEWSEKGVLQL